jgi:transcriptional regulator with XRE-family HTH domain
MKHTTISFIDLQPPPPRNRRKLRTYNRSNELRTKSNIWQTDYSYNKIAILCDMGVGEVSRIFRGIGYPRAATVKKLAKGLGCSIAEMWRLLNL